MATLAELQRQRDRILDRLSSLQTRITHGDKSVEYDLSQAKTALELLDRELAKSSGTPSLRQLRIRSAKDL